MGSLIGGAGFWEKQAGWFKSSRKGRKDIFSGIAGGKKGMSAQQISDLEAREAAKEPSGSGLQANTPLSSRYA